MTDEVLMEMLDAVTLAYMVAGDCIALDVVASTIDALANARHEIAVKNFDGFEKEFGRAASICRMPLTQLKDVMRGDYK